MSNDRVEQLLRLIRKDKLLFDREVRRCHDTIAKAVSVLFNVKLVRLIEPDLALPVWIKANYSGVGNAVLRTKKHSRRLSSDDHEADFPSLYLDALRDLPPRYLYLFPGAWQKFGALILPSELIGRQLFELSGVLEDDFVLFDEGFQNRMSFQGDRKSEVIVVWDIQVDGADFCRIGDLMKTGPVRA